MSRQKHDVETLAALRADVSTVTAGCARATQESERMKQWVDSTGTQREREVAPKVRARAAAGDAPVFITARFRSGSTLLWQLLRAVDGVVAFYEPLNEALRFHTGSDSPVDERHRGVESYWDEYLPVASQIRELHREAFGVSRLLLEPGDQYPELVDYLEFLVSSGDGRRPVLQCNRLDFRLPWLRACFPEAKIIHLTRDPREQWGSMLRGVDPLGTDEPDLNTNYDLLLWSISLAQDFPFLVEGISHPYERFYYLWRLSKIMGERCADVSVDFDREMQDDPEVGLGKLASVVELEDEEVARLRGKITRIERGRWRKLMPLERFEEIESRCDKRLADLGLLEWFGIRPLKEIVSAHAASWSPLSRDQEGDLLQKVVQLMVEERVGMMEFSDRVNRDLSALVAAISEAGHVSEQVMSFHENCRAEEKAGSTGKSNGRGSDD